MDDSQTCIVDKQNPSRFASEGHMSRAESEKEPWDYCLMTETVGLMERGSELQELCQQQRAAAESRMPDKGV